MHTFFQRLLLRSFFVVFGHVTPERKNSSGWVVGVHRRDDIRDIGFPYTSRKRKSCRERFTGRETCRRLVEARTLRMLRYVEGGRSRASYNFDSRHKGKRNSLIPSNRITKNECKMEEGRASE